MTMRLKHDAAQPTNKTRAGGDEAANRARRSFLLVFPAAVATAILASVGGAAVKFLRPRAKAGAAQDAGEWAAVAPVSELGGVEEPLARKVSVARDAGWAREVEERTVFVLPKRPPRIVSSVCPHEGCEVEWEASAKSFLCPCHDSRFDASGARLSGPAARGLDELPARVEGGWLKVQYSPAPPGTLSPVEGQARG